MYLELLPSWNISRSPVNNPPTITDGLIADSRQYFQRWTEKRWYSGRFFRAPSEIYDGRRSVSEPRKFRQPAPWTQDVCFPFEGTIFAISRAKFCANLLATYIRDWHKRNVVHALLTDGGRFFLLHRDTWEIVRRM